MPGIATGARVTLGYAGGACDLVSNAWVAGGQGREGETIAVVVGAEAALVEAVWALAYATTEVVREGGLSWARGGTKRPAGSTSFFSSDDAEEREGKKARYIGDWRMAGINVVVSFSSGGAAGGGRKGGGGGVAAAAAAAAAVCESSPHQACACRERGGAAQRRACAPSVVELAGCVIVCSALLCSVLLSSALLCSVLLCSVLFYSVLFRSALFCSAMRRDATRCDAMRCDAIRYDAYDSLLHDALLYSA